jgi:predicted metal-dependent hydrolase
MSALISRFEGGRFGARYLAYFDCFNRQLFYEAHDVLEELWLESRGKPEGDFYKGLIQLAGAFVHIQKGRPQPAASLLRLAEQNLQKYPRVQHELDLGRVEALIQFWRARVEAPQFQTKEVSAKDWPQLDLSDRRRT